MGELASLHDVTKTYKVGWRRQITALDNVSFAIPEGSLVGLVGPNGSGKSTSIKLVLGLISASRGSVSLLGDSPSNPSVFRDLGYVAESASFSDTLKAPEILKYHGRVHKVPRRLLNQRIEALLHEVGLSGHTAKSVRQFSKGMVQRLALAAALVHDPRLLIFDEPMSGLDPIGRRFVIDLLARQHRLGKTICFSSHLLHDIDEICDRLVILYKGKLVFDGPKADFVQQPSSYRLVFSSHDVSTLEVANGAEKLGPDMWSLTGSFDDLFKAADQLREAGATIIEIRPVTGSLEQRFLSLVNT